jgi:hypothetical protein
MKIKDLPKEIINIVSKNSKTEYNEDSDLSSLFYWDRSPEGHEFWSKIDDGDIDHFYTKYPNKSSKGKMFMDEYLKFGLLGDVEVKDPVVVEQPKDYIVDSVIESFKERSKTGIDKYGTTLGRDDLSFLEWLNHLQEELQDAILYAERMKSSAGMNYIYDLDEIDSAEISDGKLIIRTKNEKTDK